jgi:hypothetical protein
MGLRFFLFLAPAEPAVFFLTDGRLTGVLSAEAGDLDWATAGGKMPSHTEGENSNEKIPAKTRTAKRRTQTLPTAESWHP